MPAGKGHILYQASAKKKQSPFEEAVSLRRKPLLQEMKYLVEPERFLGSGIVDGVYEGICLIMY